MIRPGDPMHLTAAERRKLTAWAVAVAQLAGGTAAAQPTDGADGCILAMARVDAAAFARAQSRHPQALRGCALEAPAEPARAASAVATRADTPVTVRIEPAGAAPAQVLPAETLAWPARSRPAAPTAGAASADALPAAAPASAAPPVIAPALVVPAPVAPAPAAPARPAPGAAQSAPGGARPGPASRAFNERMRRLDPQVLEVARRNDLDPLLLHALIHVESRHRMDAVSPAGARGAMQLMPQTAARFGVQSPQHLHDPEFNLAAGSAYLKLLQAEFGGDLDLVLAAYNAGEGAVRRHGGRIPPYAETRAYVRDVRALHARLIAERDLEAGAPSAGDPARLAMNGATR